MTLTIRTDPAPLRVDEGGVVRVGNSRVTLDTVLGEYRKGASAETIAGEFDTITLADIHAVLAYYLRHQNEVHAYLQRREEEAAIARRQVEAAGMTRPEVGQTIQNRWALKEPDHAPPGQ